MEQEIWKPINGYEGYYSVSSFGRIRGEERIVKNPYKNATYIRKQYIKKVCLCSNKRYFNVDLYKGGKPKRLGVHQLVAHAFIGKQKKGIEVRHINGISTDNRLENLCYGTHTDNMQDATKHGNMPRGDQCHSAKLTADQVREIYLSNLPKKELINIYKVSKNTIISIQKRRMRKYDTESIKDLR
jgi:hypothetical protein